MFKIKGRGRLIDDPTRFTQEDGREGVHFLVAATFGPNQKETEIVGIKRFAPAADLDFETLRQGSVMSFDGSRFSIEPCDSDGESADARITVIQPEISYSDLKTVGDAQISSDPTATAA